MTRGLAALLAAGLLAAAPAPAPAEEILSFAAEIRVAANGGLRVEEALLYDFGAEYRHGIFRDIPVRYDRSWSADFALRLEVEGVSDEAGRPRPFRVERQGRILRIRIGEADRVVTGRQHYRIAYTVRNALLFLDEHDELYWNVTGNGWRVPIARTGARVELPPGVDPRRVPTRCLTGPLGATGSDCRVAPSSSGLDFQSVRRFGPGEGLTLVVALPKGAVAEPGPLARLLATLRALGGAWLLTPLAALGGMLALWRARGRDPRVSHAIPVRYEPPEGLRPAEVGALVDEVVDLDDVTSTILDLAVRGHLRIREVETRRFLFLSDLDYELERLGGEPDGNPGDERGGGDPELRPYEALMLGRLFEGGPRVRISSLKEKFHEDLASIVTSIYAGLSGPQRHFVRSPRKVRRRWYTLAGGLVLAALVLGSGPLPPGAALALALSAGVVALFGRSMPARTRRGRRALEEILGFREFLERVEGDRLEREGRLTTDTFERILPYAQVLGVADHWADVFADLYTGPPEWYVSAHSGRFTPRGFVSDVGHALDTMGRSVSSRPASAGSGGSGFGGGGFSGGGFGGGGGGSW